MGGAGSESKKQLGKILLQQKRVPAESKREPTMRPPLSAARQAQLARQEQLRGLSEQHGLPAVDLSEQIVPLAALRLVPVEIARERKIFAFRVDGDQLLLAMSSRVGPEVLEELEFVTGKKIQPFVALDATLRDVTEAAYARLQQGEEFYVAEHATGGASGSNAPSMSAQLRPARVPSDRPALDTELDEAFANRMAPSQPPSMPKLDVATRVLLAVREGEVRGAIKRALEEAGVSVLETADGAKALESVRDAGPQLLVIERELPSIEGLDVCRRLRASTRYDAIPILVVSHGVPLGWRLCQDLRDSFGIEHCFEQPIDVPKLAQIARMLLLGQPVQEELLPLSEAAEARWNTGMEAFHGGDIGTAIIELEAAVALDPQAFELRFHLGLLYGRRDDVFAAIRSLELALRMQPRHFLACKNLAAVFQRAGFTQRSIDMWERAMSLAPDPQTREMIREHLLGML